MGKKWLGFDRRLEPEWLDYMFDLLLDGKSKKEIRYLLMKMLEDHMKGKVAISKTATVMTRLIYNVPGDLIEKALKLMDESSGNDRLWLYWGLIIYSYPFVRDIAAVMGIILTLDGKACGSDLQERIVRKWGDSSTVKRVIQMVTKTMEDFKLIKRIKSRPLIFSPARGFKTESPELMKWFIEILLRINEKKYMSRKELYNQHFIFPFEISLEAVDKNERFALKREGLYEMVGLKDVPEKN